MDSRDQLDADFEQASKYLKDLAEVYAHQHDTSIIEEIHSLKRQLAGAFQSTQTNVKDTIAGTLNGSAQFHGTPESQVCAALQRQVENSKKTTVRPEDAGFFKQRMADLDAQRQAVLQGIAELSQEKAATLEQIQALRVKTQAVKEAADQLDAEQAARIPQVKYVALLSQAAPVSCIA